jgi:hypothetical protein
MVKKGGLGPGATGHRFILTEKPGNKSNFNFAGSNQRKIVGKLIKALPKVQPIFAFLSLSISLSLSNPKLILLSRPDFFHHPSDVPRQKLD